MGPWLVGAVLAANAALFFTWLLLIVFDAALVRAGLAQAWTLRRRLVTGAWAVALTLPFALGVVPTLPVNATDWLVAEFLNGNKFGGLSATDLAALIEARDAVPRSLASAEGPVWQVLGAIALTAALVRMVRVARSALQLRRTLRAAVPVRRIGRLRIAVSPSCSVPFAARGLRLSHVVLPATLWARPGQRRMALSHELQHLRQGDPLLELAMALISPVFALNPAFWSLIRRTRRLREHGCDAACLARPGIDARAYAICLLEVARNARSQGPGTLTVAFLGRRQRTAAVTRSQLGQRIEQIAAGPERRAGWPVTLAAVGLLGALAVGGMLLLRAPDGWSQERLLLSSVVNLERLETINSLGMRPLR